MSRRHFFKNVNVSTELESRNFSKYISELAHKVEEKSLSPVTDSYLKLSQKPAYSKREYFEELKKQVQEKEQKKAKEKEEKLKPGISQDFYGYPNLPQTPREIRRERELMKMEKVKKELRDQLDYQNESFNSSRHQEIESERVRNEIDYQLYLTEREMTRIRRENEREKLTNAWNLAKKAKELQEKLFGAEKIGIVSKLKEISIPEKSYGMVDESSQFNFETEVRENPIEILETSIYEKYKQSIKEKAEKIKESLESKERNSYQFKIKKILKEVKQQREQLKPNLAKSISHNGYYSRNQVRISQKLF